MISSADNFCKIITTGNDARKIARSTLWNVNIVFPDADRLINEPLLQVKQISSSKPGFSHCAVVKCSKHELWDIPLKILERVEKHD